MLFYIKNKNGEFLPVNIEQVFSKDWAGKLIMVRVGNDEKPAPEEELIDFNENLEKSSVISGMLQDASFIITSYAVQFDVVGSLDELRKKYVGVKITGGDDLSKLGGLQKDAREKLKGKANKIVILPTPLSVDEYYEVIKVKQRCDLRRSRRGR